MGRIQGGLVAGVLALTTWLAMAATAMAAPEQFAQVPAETVQAGAGAAELNNPRAVAGNAVTGRVYVADGSNARVSEYTAWGLFVKSWGWGVADGSSELQTCGPTQPEGDPDPILCREGIAGEGDGQLAPFLMGGMAVDREGNVWVGDIGNLRIQKFSPEGAFLLMLGGDVNKTKVAVSAPTTQRDVCPIDPGDVCGTGTAGSGPSQLASTFRDFIAYNPELDAIVVGGTDRIQIFNLNGTFREQIDFEGSLAAFDGKTVEALDVDSAGNIYMALDGLPDVYKLNSSGEPLAPGKPGESGFEIEDPTAVTVDAEGAVYAVQSSPGPWGLYAVGFDAAGNPIDGARPEDEFARDGPSDDPFATNLMGIGTNMCSGSSAPNLYVTRFSAGVRSYVSIYGPPPIGCEPPPVRPPDLLDQFATSVGTGNATVKALINPRFWDDTTYYVEYGTGKCSAGGCDKTQPLPPGALLTEKVVNATLSTAGVLLGGLALNTTYHYRFVAESSGGGPVYGIDPDGKDGPEGPTPTEGLEATFTTAMPSRAREPCPNDAVRGGPSASLPDCRAYELVSPLDKGNTDVALLREGRFTEISQAAPSADRFTFSSIAAFGELEGGAYISQYLAERGPAGWGSETISPARTTPPLDGEVALTNEFKGFTADLCQAWLRHNSAARLTTDAVLEYPNIYRRGNCTEPPSYEAITTEEHRPKAPPPDQYRNLQLKGFSEDGTHTIFVADAKLHKDAPTVAPDEPLLYEHTGGELHFVCYLPAGKATKPCGAGVTGIPGPDFSNLENAISADGSHIFWTAFPGSSGLAKPGALYVRIDGKETVAVSSSVTTARSFFWTAAKDGSKAIFEVFEGPLKGNLYEFDVATETPRLIAEEVEGLMGASEDASKIYFASSTDLDAGGPADAGAHNLYLYEAGGGGDTFTFVTHFPEQDIGNTGFIKVEGPPTPIHRQPAGRWATVSEDGRFAAFTSAMAPPSGYDNRDAASGLPAAEVYRYDSASGDLRCISCNPTGARPTAANLGTLFVPLPVAARLPGWTMNFHSPHVLSADGQRVFFESHEALVPTDTNGAWDVYQWEAPGKGTCSVDDPTFGEDAGGCVELISSGRSPADSEFLDADPSGDSAFISTQASLIGPDYGLNDVYVARVQGGFPEPRPQGECEGEACQSPPSPPPTTTPGSFSHQGPPDPKAKPRRRPCPKGKRRVKRAGKVKCVPKKRKGKAARKGDSTRRAAR
jgi:hypothetical protein